MMDKEREDVVTHLQILHTWAAFALEHRDMGFFNAGHMHSILKWTEAARKMIERDAEIIEGCETALEMVEEERSEG